jgi:hypothetical protein
MYVEILTALDLSGIASKFESIPMFVTVDLQRICCAYFYVCIQVYLWSVSISHFMFLTSVGHWFVPWTKSDGKHLHGYQQKISLTSTCIAQWSVVLYHVRALNWISLVSLPLSKCAFTIALLIMISYQVWLGGGLQWDNAISKFCANCLLFEGVKGNTHR